MVKTMQQVNFVAAGALNTDVVGTDADTTQNQFSPLKGNIIMDIQHDVDPAAGLRYTLFVRRQDLSRKRIGVSANFLTTFNGIQRPNMPISIRSGFFQWVHQQNAGALTAQNYLVTYAEPLSL
jgi:hypothetical protein